MRRESQSNGNTDVHHQWKLEMDHSRLKPWGAALLFVVLLILPACSAGKSKQLAEQGVTNFHAQLDAEQYHEIFSNASLEFQKSGTEAEFVELFSAIHRKLGKVQNAKEQTFFINYGTSGTTVTLTYKTDFASGGASEQFVWRVGEQAVLINYRVDSRLLITK
jgi:hypothetical protein